VTETKIQSFFETQCRRSPDTGCRIHRTLVSRVMYADDILLSASVILLQTLSTLLLNLC